MVVGYTIASKHEGEPWTVGFWKAFLASEAGSLDGARREAEELLCTITKPGAMITTGQSKIVSLVVPDEELL